MALLDIAIFRFRRSDYAGEISVKAPPASMDTDGGSLSLFEQAKSLFNASAQKRFGYFDPDAEHKQLSGLISNWRAQQFDFVSLATKLSGDLHATLAESDTPFDCCVMFAHESILEQHYAYALVLPMKSMQQLNGDLVPTEIDVIDSGKLSFAWRLHLQDIEQSSPKYLTQLASRGAKDLTEAWLRFSQFKEGIDITAETTEFITLVDRFTETLDADQQSNAKTQVINYCVEQDKLGLPVQLQEISGQLDEQAPDKFADYIQAHQQQRKPEVHTDRAVLKRYMRYFGRDNSLSINFSSERLGQDIIYQPEVGSLRIENIPKPLRKQLSQYREQNESDA
ncbi:MAG: nucleoid-associated protein [Pseudomonadales bacterium]|nr:nucleoid-associated protein [Pseudomonadales bacterium]